MIREVRNGEHTWQEFFEEWYLLGEDDPRWEIYESVEPPKKEKGKKEEKTTPERVDWTKQLTNIVKKIDPEQMEQHIFQLSEAIGAIQGVLAQFQKDEGSKTPPVQDREHPFLFRKD